jgi:uncharacterized membrane protein
MSAIVGLYYAGATRSFAVLIGHCFVHDLLFEDGLIAISHGDCLVRIEEILESMRLVLGSGRTSWVTWGRAVPLYRSLAITSKPFTARSVSPRIEDGPHISKEGCRSA